MKAAERAYGGCIPLRQAQFDCLPVSQRVADQLAAMLMDADEVLRALQTEEANPLLWIEPHVERVYSEIDSLIRRFAQ